MFQIVEGASGMAATTLPRCNFWSKSSTSSQYDALSVHPESRANASTAYLAQCKVPGLITLTDTQLVFTPLTSSAATTTVDLKSLIGVKRSSLAKGLRIRWSETQPNGIDEEKEEKFLCVSQRDELFAKLIGVQGRRWLAV